MRFTVSAALLVCVLVASASCQDCDYPSNSDLEDVIADIFAAGGNPATPTVAVTSFHLVCLVYSQDECDRYSAVSVVVQHTCSGNPNCPSGTAMEQIESECNNGEWSNNVQGSTEHTRSEVSEANFATTVRDACSFCLSPELATILSRTTDTVTHCVGECFT